MNGADWQPIVVALAALIVAATPALVGLLVSLATHVSVKRIETNTNGALAALQSEVEGLRAEVAGRRSGDKKGEA